MEEIWKDIKGYEGYYQISNMGNVKSLERTVTKSNGVVQIRKERIMNKRESTDGYYIAKLNVNNHSKSIAIHRLVAQHFIPNPDNLPEVNHIDTNRKNNRVDNLEWCTHKDNVRYSADKGHYRNNKFGSNNGRARRVSLYNSDHQLIDSFDYIGDCARYMIDNQMCKQDYSTSYINNLRSQIGKAAKTNKKYLNCYFKYL